MRKILFDTWPGDAGAWEEGEASLLVNKILRLFPEDEVIVCVFKYDPKGVQRHVLQVHIIIKIVIMIMIIVVMMIIIMIMIIILVTSMDSYL